MHLSEHRIRMIFRVGIILKALHALIEIAGGLAFHFVSTQAMLDLVNTWTQAELVEDPHDLIATHILAAAHGLTGSSQNFYAWYLVSHGLIKVILVAGLLRGKLIAYPASLIALTAFVAYQLYRYSYSHSVGLLVLTMLDLIVMILVWHEWRRLQRPRAVG